MSATFPPAGGAALCCKGIQEKMPGIFGGVVREDDVFTGQGFDDPAGDIVWDNDIGCSIGRSFFLDTAIAKAKTLLFQRNPALAIRASNDDVV